MFTRLKNDFGAKLVKDVLSLLACTRRGVMESELLELLKIPYAVWAPLRHVLSPFLIMGQGEVLMFFHQHLGVVVKKLYLPQMSQEIVIHQRLGDFFK